MLYKRRSFKTGVDIRTQHILFEPPSPLRLMNRVRKNSLVVRK